MSNYYLKWERSMLDKLKYEDSLRYEADKVFKSGGRVVTREITSPSGKKQTVNTLEFGRYTPKMKLSKKGLKKLGIFVEEVKYAEKRKKDKKKLDNETNK